MKCKPLLFAAALLCIATAAQAAAIYRCGVAGNLYSDKPCLDGRILAASDERSDTQRTEGLRVAVLERRLANEMQRERLMQEAAAPRAAANLGARPAVVLLKVVALPHSKRAAKRKDLRLAGRDIDFVAYAPGTVKSSRR